MSKRAPSDSDSLEPILRQVAAAPPVAPPVELTPGTLIDGYRVERAIGAGGMGIVYLAHDLDLDRAVALKLHSRISDSGVRRLEREARAMAQLAHPNVVTVHEVGTFRDRVYLVMEYVPGGTVRTWLEARERSLRQVLDIYRQAGAGLAAAHAAGLVHRDFKPDNVLVGADGRVRVADFGLARAVLDAEPVATNVELPHAETVSGAGMAGTPAYMAPEQFQGRADARTDQFAFCVSVFEALGGQRPRAAPLSGTGPGGQLDFEVEIPTVEGVPRRLGEVLARGLAAEPGDRYPDMAALLAELDRALAPPRWRRPAILVAALAIAGAGGALVAARAAGGDGEPCAHTRGALAATWNPTRAASLGAALTGSGAGDLAPAIVRGIEGYAGRWSEARYRACTDTRVHARQTAEQLERRVACLETGRRELDALVGLLATADRELLARGSQAVGALPDVSHCADPQFLASALPGPPAAAAAEVERLRTELSEVAARLHLGRYAEAAELASRALEQARPLEYTPLTAEAQLALGSARVHLGDTDAARQDLTEAYFAARASRHDEAAIDAAITLGGLQADLASFADAGAWFRHAQADIIRLGRADFMQAKLLRSRATLAELEGRLDDAIAYAREAVALYRASDADDTLIADAQMRLGTSLDLSGKADEALAIYEQALATLERTHGDEHPALTDILSNIGLTLSAAGRTDEAIASHRRALAISERYRAPDHVETGYVLLNLGVAQDAANQHEDAIATYQRALSVIEKALGPEHPDAALVHNSLGVAYGSLERTGDAIRHYQRALDIQRATLPADHIHLAIATGNLGGVLSAAGRPADALPLIEQAIDIWTRAAPDSANVSYPLTDLGTTYLAMGRPRDALAPLERALTLRQSTEMPADVLAETRFALARALWDTGTDRPRARRLAEQALAVFGDDTPTQRQEVTDWLELR